MTVATLTRISRRDLSDVVVRSLRVAGVSHGEAKRTAALLDHLEVHRGQGVAMLAELVGAGLDRLPIPDRIDVRPAGSAGVTVDAGATTALLLAPALVDLIRVRAATGSTLLWLTSARQLATLDAVIAATARADVATVTAFQEHGQLVCVVGCPTPEGPAVLVDRWARPPRQDDHAGLLADAAEYSVEQLPETARAQLRAAIATAHEASRPGPPHAVAVIAAAQVHPGDADAETRRRAAASRSRDEQAWASGLTVEATAWDQVLEASRTWLVDDERQAG